MQYTLTMKSGDWKSKIINDSRIIFVHDDYDEFADNGGVQLNVKGTLRI
jgi:hypothetical protein